jgi:hypothetical protein
MILRHHDLVVELDDAWWVEAQLIGFVPSGTCYRAEPDARWGRAIFEAPIEAVGPVRRVQGVGQNACHGRSRSSRRLGSGDDDAGWLLAVTLSISARAACAACRDKGSL